MMIDKTFRDSFMIAIFVVILKKLLLVMSGTIVFTNQTMEATRLNTTATISREPLQLTKISSKTRLSNDEKRLNAQTTLARAQKLLVLPSKPKTDSI